MVGEKGKANTSPVRTVFSTCKIRYELIKSTEMQWMYELWVEPKSQDFLILKIMLPQWTNHVSLFSHPLIRLSVDFVITFCC